VAGPERRTRRLFLRCPGSVTPTPIACIASGSAMRGRLRGSCTGCSGSGSSTGTPSSPAGWSTSGPVRVDSCPPLGGRGPGESPWMRHERCSNWCRPCGTRAEAPSPFRVASLGSRRAFHFAAADGPKWSRWETPSALRASRPTECSTTPRSSWLLAARCCSRSRRPPANGPGTWLDCPRPRSPACSFHRCGRSSNGWTGKDSVKSPPVTGPPIRSGASMRVTCTTAYAPRVGRSSRRWLSRRRWEQTRHASRRYGGTPRRGPASLSSRRRWDDVRSDGRAPPPYCSRPAVLLRCA